MSDSIPELSKVGSLTICPVAIIVRQGKVLMGLRHYTPDKWKSISVWTVPGGRCDGTETLETTLFREVKEETGIDDLQIIKYLGESQGAKTDDTVPMFACISSQNPQLIEPEKFSEWKWFSAPEFPQNYINPPALKIIRKYLREEP